MFGTHGLGGHFFYNFNQLTNLICKLNLIIWLCSASCGDLNEKEIQKRGNIYIHMGFPNGSEVKNPPTMQETWQEPWVRFLPQNIPWRRKWQALWQSCMENPMDRGAWKTTVHRVTKESDTTQRLCNNNKVYIWLIHFAVQQKIPQHCKATIFP